MTTTMPTPRLSNDDWSVVATALADASRCGCANPRAAEGGSLVDRVVAALFGRSANEAADPAIEAVRRFVCATSRRRRTAEDLAPALVEHGFSRAQIDALALLLV